MYIYRQEYIYLYIEKTYLYFKTIRILWFVSNLYIYLYVFDFIYMCIYNTFLDVKCPFQHGIDLYCCTDHQKLKFLMSGVT